MKKLTLISTKGNSPCRYYVFSQQQQQYIPLDERYFSKHIPGYANLNEKAREKARIKYLKGAEIIKQVQVPDRIPNITKGMYKKHPPNVPSLLSLCDLFEEMKTGYFLLADILCGAHITSIHKIEPEFRPTLSISSSSSAVAELFAIITKSIFPVIDWTTDSIKFRYKHILDYCTEPQGFPSHVQDFTVGKVKVKGQKKFKFPMPYSDSAVLVIGADNSQIQETVPYLADTAVILLNSAAGNLNPTKLSSIYVAAYDPKTISQIKQNAKNIASVLYWWQNYALSDEDAWARQIVQEARVSFGKPDSRYIQVELDPKKLRDAIRYRVLLSFLDEVEFGQLVTPEELTSYRQGAKDVFDPAPAEPVVNRHAEDPDIFMEIMRELVANPPATIVNEGERFIKKGGKHFAAWRTISKERYLVLLEEIWAKAYKKAVQGKKTIDTSFFCQERWELDIQKILSENGLIKQASAGYRYRYDLMENKTRDSTYVLAIPAHLLE